MKRKLILFSLAAGLLAACSKDDGKSSEQITEKQNEIFLQTNIRSMQEGTRATTYDDAAALQVVPVDVKVYAYFHNTEISYLNNAGETLHYDSGEPAGWKFWNTGTSSQLHYYWSVEGAVTSSFSVDPVTVSSLDFVGYCPYDKPAYITSEPTYNHTDGISFTSNLASYMTNTTQSGITEYMCAILPAQTLSNQTDAGGSLPLQLKHPFARIRLQLAANHPNVTIHSITLRSLNTGGTYTLTPANVSSWSSLSGEADLETSFTGDAANFNSNPATPLSIGTDLIVIPQNWAGVIEVNADCLFWGVMKNYPALTTTIPTNWQPGYSYTYTFNISPDDLKVNIARYTEQW